MSKVIVFLINIYQKIPTKAHSSCPFIPTCSQYSKEAFVKYGFLKGLYLSIFRILRCHPWQKPKYDPVE